jgi:outer membrane biosynthesis protein TonB
VVLAGIMVIASAFMSSRPKESKMAAEFISAGAVEAALGGGSPRRGNPATQTAGSPRPAPAQPQAPVQAPPVTPPVALKTPPAPEVVEQPVQPTPRPRISKDAIEPKPEVQKPSSQAPANGPNAAKSAAPTKSYVLKKASPSSATNTPKTSPKPPTSSDSGESAQKQWSKEVGGLVERLSKSGNGGVAIPSVGAGSGSGNRSGPGGGGGGGGQGMGDYSALVKAVYDNAWVDPSDVNDSSAEVDVEVVIARSGAVVSARIVSRSKISSLNASVQRALDRVTRIPQAFPPDIRDNQLSFTIRFNLGNRRRFG